MSLSDASEKCATTALVKLTYTKIKVDQLGSNAANFKFTNLQPLALILEDPSSRLMFSKKKEVLM